MRVIEDHGIDELILTKLLGWKWMSFLGMPTNDHPNYRDPDVREKGLRVRELFSPKQLESQGWQEYFEKHEGREADGTEPLSYRYCSSMGPARPPRLFILVDDSWSG
jgi:hypothetical protein